MRVLVCGSRDWQSIHTIRMRLIKLPASSVIIHGGAPGADRTAAFLAEDFGFTVEEYPADWKQYGKRAGIIRNLQMLDTNPDLVVAFHRDNSPGTAHTIREARKRGILVEVYEG